MSVFIPFEHSLELDEKLHIWMKNLCIWIKIIENYR
jgi:hypothetical protein